MNIPAKHPSALPRNSLRRNAEAALASLEAATREKEISPGEYSEILHELLVHQIELEMQNEELQQLHASLAASRAVYFDLFEHAPVGYLVLDESGQIVEANQTAASVLGVPRKSLVSSPLTRIVQTEDRDVSYLMLKKLTKTGRPQNCRLRLLRKDGDCFWARMEAAIARDWNKSTTVRLSFSDISETIRAAEKLSKAEQDYRMLALNSTDAVVRLDADGGILWVSPSIHPILGWEIHDWLGQNITHFLTNPAEAAPLTGKGPEAAWKSGPFSLRARMRAGDKSTHWVEIHGGPYKNADGSTEGLALSLHTIDREVAMEAELEKRARTDDLTNLPNRKEALARIETLRTQTPRTGAHPALLFCDFDSFKTINDTRGHAAGDEVLRVTAARLQARLRGDDSIAARFGGDEILVVLKGIRRLEDAISVAEKLRIIASVPIEQPGDLPLHTTLSIGVTLAAAGESTDCLVARADAAMYHAKQSGRDRVFALPVVDPARAGTAPIETGV